MDHNQTPSLPLQDSKRGRAALHSVQRPQGKPWKKPEQPSAPKVYRVDPRGFRDLVQQLTGAHAAPQLLPRPRPQPLAELSVPAPSLFFQSDLGGDDRSIGAASGGQSPTAGFLQGLLSPSLYSSWCSFPLLSPAEHI